VSATVTVSTSGVSESTNRERIRSEYIDMPGLVLTVSQAARLLGITPRQSELLLSELASSGFLVRDKKRSYRRR
jgi:Fic family protein